MSKSLTELYLKNSLNYEEIKMGIAIPIPIKDFRKLKIYCI